MKDVNQSVNTILDQAIARAQAQLDRHTQSLKDMQEVNELLKKQGRPLQDTTTMEQQVQFYTDQIEELKARKS